MMTIVGLKDFSLLLLLLLFNNQFNNSTSPFHLLGFSCVYVCPVLLGQNVPTKIYYPKPLFLWGHFFIHEKETAYKSY